MNRLPVFFVETFLENNERFAETAHTLGSIFDLQSVSNESFVWRLIQKFEKTGLQVHQRKV